MACVISCTSLFQAVFNSIMELQLCPTPFEDFWELQHVHVCLTRAVLRPAVQNRTVC